MSAKRRGAGGGRSAGRTWVLAVALMALGVMPLLGCAARNGVLEIDSGPAGEERDAWRVSRPAVYAVHTGEQAMLRFRSKTGVCDYAHGRDVGTGEYFDCGTGVNGRFEWLRGFEVEEGSDEDIRLEVSGYRQVGARDRMPIGGRLVEGRRRGDPADILVARGEVSVVLYQSMVEIPVQLAGGRPDWGRSELVLRPRTPDARRIVLNRSGRRGFTVMGPDEDGVWQVRYAPTAGEVNHSGETAAELVVADKEGRTSVFGAVVVTP